VTERLPSDHDSIESHRVHLERVGRTSRTRVPLPADLSLAADDVVWLSIGGESAHARVEGSLAGEPAFAGAYENARLARTGEGTDHLRQWTERHDLTPGEPVWLDVLRSGYAYGLRRPGERVIYAPPDPPDDSLASIAADLEE
jgi:hypothetical protein